MLAINYSSKTTKRNSQNDFIRQLKQKAQIEKYYTVENRRLQENVPQRPKVPKENLTDEDIERDLRVKLAPYMINNRELVSSIEGLKAAGSLRSFDDLFELFRKKYLIGVSRLTNLGLQALYTSFVDRTL